MIQGKFQLLNCYLIKNIAKAQIYRCTVNYIFLSTYSSYYHLCTTLISSVFVCLIECCIVFVFCWFNIETKDRIEAVFWQRLCHCQSLCQNSFREAKLDVAHVISIRSHLETDKKITLEQRRSDRNKNRQQQMVNSLFGKLWNWQLTMKMEL